MGVDGLLILAVELGHEHVSERLLGRGSQGRVEEQGRPQEVPGLGRHGGKHFGGALGLHQRPLRATCEMAGRA